MIKLLRIEYDEGVFSFSVEEGGEYVHYTSEGGEFVKLSAQNTTDYRSYDHYANVIGKFNPYKMFLNEPVEIEEVTEEELKRAYKELFGKEVE